MDIKAWRLQTDSNNAVVLRTELDYFQNNFNGNSLVNTWEPPNIRIQGKSKKLNDFISWMLCAPVISEKAKSLLEPLISPYVEFLPLITLRGTKYFAVNVTHLVKCLDFERSEICFAPDDPSYILNISRTYFVENNLDTAPIFKTVEWPLHVFVTPSFVDVVLANNLVGAIFADHKINIFESLLGTPNK